VLLVQTSFLGDALLTVPLARRIKETLPGCRLTVLTRPKTMDIFRRASCVDEVLAYDKRAAHAGIRGLWSLSRALRQQRFDLALVAHRSFRSALLVWLARIPHRIGFSSSAGWFLFNRTVFFPWGMPELERNLALLLPLKPDLRSESGDSLYLGRAGGEGLAGRLRSSGVADGDRLVGIHPGSVWPTKRWPAERYAELARELVARARVKVLLLGGKEDAALNAGIAEAAGPGAVNWAGLTTLPELMDLVPRLSLLVTNDSGPMHIAAGSGVPTLAIFGPTTRELGFFPYGEGHRVLQVPLECRPCGLHGSRSCPEGHFLCMRLIGAREVLDNAMEMLGKSPEGTSP
jgi:heptosyltransferase-2